MIEIMRENNLFFLVTESFKVDGLPTKLVIDSQGTIRFKSSGFISLEDAIPEISSMIEMAKKNND